MESKQIWMTVVIAVVVSIVVSIMVVVNATSPQLAPQRVSGITSGGNSTPVLPDLIVSGISTNNIIQCPIGGINGSIYCERPLFVTVQNIGIGVARDSMLQLVVLDGSNSYFDLVNITSLASGQSQQVLLSSGQHPSGTNYTAWANSDEFNQVIESNENNNVATYQFSL